jgi:hypothetical protein
MHIQSGQVCKEGSKEGRKGPTANEEKKVRKKENKKLILQRRHSVVFPKLNKTIFGTTNTLYCKNICLYKTLLVSTLNVTIRRENTHTHTEAVKYIELSVL